MNSFNDFMKKWGPYIRPKAKKIVAVQFEDGTIIETDQAELRVYLRLLDNRRSNDAARQLGANSIDQFNSLVYACYRIEQSEHASAPRNAVTKKQLEEYKKDHEEKYGKKHGWIKAASADLSIDGKTIKNRMKE